MKIFLKFLVFSLVFTTFSEFSFSQLSYPIVFVSRNHQVNGNIFFPQAGLLPGMGAYSRFKAPGGRLLIRETNGNIISLVDSTKNFNGISLVDVQQPCVHWNGLKIIFAGIEHRDSSWRIYEIKTDGTGFRKLTFTNRIVNLAQFGAAASRFLRYDDIDPIYTPDNKIVFASTRFPSLALNGDVQTTNLYIMDSTGSNLFRMTTERNGAEKPTVDESTGRIIYSRWLLNIDMPSNQTSSGLTRNTSLALPNADSGNVWQPIIAKPDGDAITLYAGDPRTRIGMSGYRPRTGPDGKLLSMYISDRTLLFTGSSTGVRYSEKGLAGYNNIIGVNPSTPLYVQSPPSTNTMVPPYAADPVMLPDGKVMLSYASTVEAQDYGIYTINLSGTGLTPVLDFPQTLELNAEVVTVRTVPPVIPYIIDFDTNSVPPTTNPESFYQGGLFRFDCLNVYANAPVDAPIDDAPPITLRPKMRFFLNFQRQDPQGKDNPILFREINVDNTGFIAEGDIPANVSMFEQITDSAGNILVNSKGNISHVAGLNFGIRGSGTKCVGCHAGHTQQDVPPTITEGLHTNVSTSAEVTASSFLPDHEGKKVVDRKARTTDQQVNWIAQGGNNEFVDLKWKLYIDTRRLTLYNIIPNTSNNTNIKVTDCEIFMYRDTTLMRHIPSTGAIDTGGTIIQVSPAVTINRVKVVVKSYTGLINGNSRAGIAEIETNAKISYDNNTAIEPGSEIADGYGLYQNYPNPFNPVTKITFSIPKRSNVSLKVYDVNGKEITTLIEGRMEKGFNSITFNGERFASGIYFYRIISGDFMETKKMVLLK